MNVVGVGWSWLVPAVSPGDTGCHVVTAIPRLTSSSPPATNRNFKGDKMAKLGPDIPGLS